MENLCKKIVEKLIEQNKTISFMESCTGGLLSHLITNTEGCSKILKVGLITYSNEYKVKFGVSKKIIDEYSVYSIETAKEMAKNVSEFAKSNIGVGITGELAKDSSNVVYYAIYLKDLDMFMFDKINAIGISRNDKKNYVARVILEKIYKGEW